MQNTADFFELLFSMDILFIILDRVDQQDIFNQLETLLFANLIFILHQITL